MTAMPDMFPLILTLLKLQAEDLQKDLVEDVQKRKIMKNQSDFDLGKLFWTNHMHVPVENTRRVLEIPSVSQLRSRNYVNSEIPYSVSLWTRVKKDFLKEKIFCLNAQKISQDQILIKFFAFQLNILRVVRIRMEAQLRRFGVWKRDLKNHFRWRPVRP